MIKTRAGDLVEGGKRAQRIIRRGQLSEFTGYSIPHIYELIANGRFPKPIPLGERAVGWLESDLVKWQEDRIAERDSAAA